MLRIESLSSTCSWSTGTSSGERGREPDAITHPDGMQIKITRQEIAKIVGCSREMVGRVLKELEEQGLITAHGKTIVVFAVEMLVDVKSVKGSIKGAIMGAIA